MSAANRAKTYCIRNHELRGDNLVRSQLENAGIRNCRTCWNENARARWRRNSRLKICHKCGGALVRRPKGWKICLKCTDRRERNMLNWVLDNRGAFGVHSQHGQKEHSSPHQHAAPRSPSETREENRRDNKRVNSPSGSRIPRTQDSQVASGQRSRRAEVRQ